MTAPELVRALREEADEVRIEAESLSLSRPVPVLLKPAASLISTVSVASRWRGRDAMRRFLMDIGRT